MDASTPSPAATPAATPKLNCCQQVLVGILILLETSGVVFSAVTLSNCNFFQFSQKAGNVPLSVAVPQETSAFATSIALLNNETSSLGAPTSTLLVENITVAGFGLLQWSPNLLGCADYADRSQLGTAFRTGQVGGLMGVTFGLAAVLLNVTELLCCRFVCAKVLACLALIAAIVGQGLTFVLYASDVCLHRGNVVYACEYGPGCGWSVVAFLCLLLSSLLICPTPKPTPLCKQVCDLRHRSNAHDAPVTDPCCYCFRGHNKEEEEVKEKKKDGEDANGADGKSTTPTNQDVEAGKSTNGKAAAGTAAIPASSNLPSTHSDSVYNDTMTDDPNNNTVVNGNSRMMTPVPSSPNSYYYNYNSYPQEVYTRSRTAPTTTTDAVSSMPMAGPGPTYDDNGGGGGGGYYYVSSSASVPGTVGTSGPYYYYRPQPMPPPLPPPPAPAPPQYHYFAPPAPPSSQLASFANAEVMDGDLFFDSKTV